MCRNHSHATVEPTGFVRVGPTTLIEYRVLQPLVLDLPYGEKWTRASMTALWVPVSMREPLPASTAALMAVCYTPLSYMVDGAMTAMHATVQRPMSSSTSVLPALSPMGSSPTSTDGGYDDDLPF